MKTQTTQAMMPHSLRRNRTLLTCAAAVIIPVAALAMGWYAANHQAGPLLLAVDQLPAVEPDHRFETSLDMNRGSSTDIVAPATAAVSSRRHDGLVLAPPLANIAPVADLADGPLPAPPSDAASPGLQPRVRRSLDVTPSVSEAYDFNEHMRWFNGRPIRPVRTMTMIVTAYSPDERSCGSSADGITASGYSVWTNGMKMAAADTSVLPFGSLISVPGYDDENVVPVLDRGGAIKGNRLDMLQPTDAQARRWGSQRLAVTVWEYADGKPNDFKATYTGIARAD